MVYRGAPQEFLYQNQTLSEVSNRSLVVQPLISKDQTFDIAVSVWIRATAAEEMEWRAGQGELYTPLVFEDDRKLLFRPLYSDIVFRGLRLSDKNKYASVNFTFPTEKFREGMSTPSLMGTFVLIPTSPSLMDFVVNYSSYIPDEVWSKLPSSRTWPFPMGSEYTGERTVANLALESFALQTPLIQYHEVPSRCPQDFTFPGFQVDAHPHPHVLTWSQLRVVEETHLMNLEAYNAAHEELKKTSCGVGLVSKPLRQFCKQHYLATGNLETRLELEIKDAEGAHTEWAYAPYMTVDHSATGPMDHIPVPVDQERCEDAVRSPNVTSLNFNESDSMDITWHITFSGRTPVKHLVTSVDFVYSANHSQNRYEKLDAQDEAELRSELFFSVHFMAFEEFTSPVHIPDDGFSCMSYIRAERQLLLRMFVFLGLPKLVWTYWMLRTVLRIEPVRKGWVSVFKRRRSSHAERTSERLDATISWRVRCWVFCALFLFFYVTGADQLELISASNSDPTSRPHSQSSTALFFSSFNWSTSITGQLFQIVLNSKSGYFSGTYKAVSFSIWLNTILSFLHHVPAVVGRYEMRPALSLPTVLDWCVQSMMVYQALRFPAAATVGPERDED
ncbi:hypothetical protein D9758_008110 [Tetrapyrgos nigripes]|uniref:Uncharacterized protein n=1 Tax=Tetrapyrgos nigripes TaxID=182062 RepID=A0A8H5GH34_9AGAR|nr:hypothetical protein D9758_008110 [Tetrapyrgos nigripes]